MMRCYDLQALFSWREGILCNFEQAEIDKSDVVRRSTMVSTSLASAPAKQHTIVLSRTCTVRWILSSSGSASTASLLVTSKL